MSIPKRYLDMDLGSLIAFHCAYERKIIFGYERARARVSVEVLDKSGGEFRHSVEVGRGSSDLALQQLMLEAANYFHDRIQGS